MNHTERGRACRSTVRRASAPLGASADQDVTVHVHAIRPIHQPISRCLPRARTQCPRKKLPLATRDATRGVVCGCFSRFRPNANDPQVWDVTFGHGAAPEARLPLRSSCGSFGVPLIHTYPLSVNDPGSIYYSFSHLIGAGPVIPVCPLVVSSFYAREHDARAADSNGSIASPR